MVGRTTAVRRTGREQSSYARNAGCTTVRPCPPVPASCVSGGSGACASHGANVQRQGCAHHRCANPVEHFCSAPDSSSGASAGLGKVAALELSRKGFTVVGACRNLEKGSAVAEQIAKQGGAMEVMQLDLADLASVRLFARQFLAKHPRCDVLLNNAGVMAPPTRQQTVDGFELQARQALERAHDLGGAGNTRAQPGTHSPPTDGHQPFWPVPANRLAAT